jgi:lipopolysaccharide transport system ATP-binding protein
LANVFTKGFRFFTGDQAPGTGNSSDFWALKDISFDIQQGEVVGIIGHNGAGKTTLLKILSQITEPTEGEIRIRGRVASLLEVGTGFHPELTGRENIFLNGAILGMKRVEIKRKFDEIATFAEVEKFIDMPVKRYSSGMYVRLAFAVAAHLDPDILLVDEVLAVGDIEFQKKCLGKMGAVAQEGRTILFVSHNLSAISHLCNRGLLLSQGRAIFDGAIEEALARYTKSSLDKNGQVILRPHPLIRGKSEVAAITRVFLSDNSGDVSDTFFIGEGMTINFDIMFFEAVPEFQLSFIVCSSTGTNIYHCVSRDVVPFFTGGVGQVSVRAKFPQQQLYPGTYIIDEVWLATPRGDQLDLVKNCITFHVPEGGPHVNRVLAKHAAVVHAQPVWSFGIAHGNFGDVCASRDVLTHDVQSGV